MFPDRKSPPTRQRRLSESGYGVEESTVTSDRETSINDLRQLVQDFVDERKWGKYHNAKDIAISIAIEAAELLELFQWVREKEIGSMLKDAENSERLEEELADIMILCLNLANVIGIDAAEAVVKKVEKNRVKYPVELVKGSYRKYTKLKDDKAG
ncbi:MAG: nucleotide pyrophosphohydrolase [Dehalococcoidia bacterium]|nr:nucleotide pyrophosphohydrolase [Dehalococcoidia bacterium]